MGALMVPDALAARLEVLALHRGLPVEELLGSLVEEAEHEDLADHAAADAGWAEQGDAPLRLASEVFREIKEQHASRWWLGRRSTCRPARSGG